MQRLVKAWKGKRASQPECQDAPPVPRAPAAPIVERPPADLDELQATIDRLSAELSRARTDLQTEAARTERAAETARARVDFLARLAQELRVPLTVITLAGGNLDTLYDRLDDARRREMVRDIREAARSLNDLLGTVLDVARIGAGQVYLEQQRLDLAAVVRDEGERHVLLARRKSQDLRVAGFEHLIVSGDEETLRRAIRNLFDHVVDFTPQGGQITCGIGTLNGGRGPEGAWPGSAGLPAGRWAGVRIAGGVAGVPYDERDTPDTAYSVGIGEDEVEMRLGLAMAREVLELLGGHLVLAATRGNAGALAFYLPLLPAPEDESVDAD